MILNLISQILQQTSDYIDAVLLTMRPNENPIILEDVLLHKLGSRSTRGRVVGRYPKKVFDWFRRSLDPNKKPNPGDPSRERIRNNNVIGYLCMTNQKS